MLDDAQHQLDNLLRTEWAHRGTAPDEMLLKMTAELEELKLLDDDDPDFDPVAYVREAFDDHNFLYLRKETPIARGTHQVVLRLTQDYVAKTRPCATTSTHYVISPQSAYEDVLRSTNQALADLGFAACGILLPEHHFLQAERDGNAIRTTLRAGMTSFVITPDLTANGRYALLELDDDRVKALANAPALQHTTEHALASLQVLYEDPHSRYYVGVNGHATADGPQAAFRHLFLVQVDPQTNTGQLAAADQDHLYFKQR